MMFQRHMKVMDLACVLEEFGCRAPSLMKSVSDLASLGMAKHGKNDIFTSHLIGR